MDERKKEVIEEERKGGREDKIEKEGIVKKNIERIKDGKETKKR